jgi:pantothenate kinase-related protein Tda10
MSVGRAVGAIHGKVEEIEPVHTDVTELKTRLEDIESTLSAHTNLLDDIFKLLKLATDPDDEVVEFEAEAEEEAEAEAEEEAEVELDEEAEVEAEVEDFEVELDEDDEEA